MAKWSNWSGRVRCEPSALVAISDEAEAVAVVQRARHEGRRLRVAGAGHSHAPLVPTDGIVVDSSGLTGVVAVDAEAGLARIRAGTRIADLGAPLRSAGVALLNQGEPLSLLRIVSRDLVAEVLVSCVGNPDALGKTFELCEGGSVPLNEQLATLSPDSSRPLPARTPLYSRA